MSPIKSPMNTQRCAVLSLARGWKLANPALFTEVMRMRRKGA